MVPPPHFFTESPLGQQSPGTPCPMFQSCPFFIRTLGIQSVMSQRANAEHNVAGMRRKWREFPVQGMLNEASQKSVNNFTGTGKHHASRHHTIHKHHAANPLQSVIYTSSHIS